MFCWNSHYSRKPAFSNGLAWGKSAKNRGFGFLFLSKGCRSFSLFFEVLFAQWVCGFVSHQRRYGFPHLLDKNKIVCAYIEKGAYSPTRATHWAVNACHRRCRLFENGMSLIATKNLDFSLGILYPIVSAGNENLKSGHFCPKAQDLSM